jgi:hypothetical protein
MLPGGDGDYVMVDECANCVFCYWDSLHELMADSNWPGARDSRLRDIHEELRQNRLNITVEYGSKSQFRLYTSELEPILRIG